MKHIVNFSVTSNSPEWYEYPEARDFLACFLLPTNLYVFSFCFTSLLCTFLLFFRFVQYFSLKTRLSFSYGLFFQSSSAQKKSCKMMILFIEVDTYSRKQIRDSFSCGKRRKRRLVIENCLIIMSALKILSRLLKNARQLLNPFIFAKAKLPRS